MIFRTLQFISFLFLTIGVNSYACHAFADVDTAVKSIHFTNDNGLPSNCVYCSKQDRNGYIWMATDKGVVKYDGYTYRVFTTADGLPQSDVWYLHEDKNDKIWILSNAHELGYIKNDKYVKVYTSSTSLMLSQFVETKDYMVFQEHEGYYLIVNEDDHVFRLILRYYGNKRLDFLSRDGELIRFDDNNGIGVLNFIKQTYLKRNSCSINKNDIYSKYGTIIFANDHKTVSSRRGYGHVLYVFDIPTCSMKAITLDKNESISYAIPSNKINDKGYFVFTDKNMYTLNRQFNVINKMKFSTYLPGQEKICYYFKDNADNTWLSTANKGVLLVPPRSRIFVKNIQSHHLGNSRFMYSAANGDSYWWNSNLKLLQVFDRDFSPKYSQAFQQRILAISAQDSSTLYFSMSFGLYKYSIKEKKCIDFLYSYPISYINNDKTEPYKESIEKRHNADSVIYYQTGEFVDVQQYNSKRIYAVNTKIMAFDLYKDSSSISVLAYEKLKKIVFDSLDNIYWFYNEDGLAIVSPIDNHFCAFASEYLKLLSIKNLKKIQFDGYGNVYILTAESLIVFNRKGISLKYVYPKFRFTNADMVIHKNVLIVAGDFGVGYSFIHNSKLSPFMVESNPNGLYYRDIYNLGIINNPDRILLNTDKGVYVFSIDSLTSGSELQSQYSNGFSWMTAKLSQKTYRLARVDTLLVDVNDNAIHFDLINYYGKGTRNYTYRIDNAAWENSESGDVFYRWIPGKYHCLEITAKDDIWRSNKFTFYVMQTPLWWQTSTWKRIFWIGGILVLIGISIVTALITRYYVRKNNAKKQALTDMELRALYAQINPHFIFNTLGTAQFFINRKKMDEAYNHVNKFSRLLRSYLKASGNRFVNLGEEIALLKDYIELQQIRFEQKFEYSIEVDNRIARDSMLIPTLLLQPLVENAINHGLFHLSESEKGLLQIKFQQGKDSEELICIIEDNGVGRERSKSIKKDSTIAKDESYGTTLTKKLIDIFKEYEKMNIYLEYIDKTAPHTGTIVRLIIGNIKYEA
jgi:hypothetical protein